MMAAELGKGTTVEICPFRANYSHHYIAHLDGEQGVVEDIKGDGEDMKVSVRLACNRALVPFPAKALKPVEDEAKPA
jgi:hypothetical protein